MSLRLDLLRHGETELGGGFRGRPFLHIGPRAEALAGTRQNQGAAIAIRLGGMDRIAQFLQQIRAERIAHVGPLQRQDPQGTVVFNL